MQNRSLFALAALLLIALASPARAGDRFSFSLHSRSGSGSGAALGAIVGGFAGNQVGGGHGRAAATAIGAIVGARVGSRYDGPNDQAAYYGTAPSYGVSMNYRGREGYWSGMDYQSGGGVTVYTDAGRF